MQGSSKQPTRHRRPTRSISLALFGTYRIGEATNPGPEPDKQKNLTYLGCINPTGILGKGALINQLPGEGNQQVWGVSETHLTAQGMTKFRQELRFHSPHLQFRAGYPTPPKTSGIRAIGGQAKGVGFLASVPSRLSSQNSQLPEWDSARLMDARSLSANDGFTEASHTAMPIKR